MAVARYAPSPTGSLQIGNALTAMANNTFVHEDGRWDARPAADEARQVLRELRDTGGNLRALRPARNRAATGPKLWRVAAALPCNEALRRVDAAL